MSFEHAPITKGLMLGVAATSIVAGVFDVKHYLHLQLVPHLSQHHQYWRLLAHQLAFSNSSDLFVAELILWHVGVHVERLFGSLKYASFALLTSALTTLLSFLALILLHPLLRPLHLSQTQSLQLRGGPAPLVFAILWQYARIVPRAYVFRVFGIVGSNKAFVYALAATLALPSPLPALTGLLAGLLYRSDIFPSIGAWRVPPKLAALGAAHLRGAVGSTRAPRRMQRAVPEERERERDAVPVPITTTAASARPPRDPAPGQAHTLIAPPPQGTRTQGQSPSREQLRQLLQNPAPPAAPRPAPAQIPAPGTGPGPLQAWLSTLSEASAPPAGLRVPPEAEIRRVAGMFPALPRSVVVGALQRSERVEGAVGVLLGINGQGGEEAEAEAEAGQR